MTVKNKQLDEKDKPRRVKKDLMKVQKEMIRKYFECKMKDRVGRRSMSEILNTIGITKHGPLLKKWFEGFLDKKKIDYKKVSKSPTKEWAMEKANGGKSDTKEQDGKKKKNPKRTTVSSKRTPKCPSNEDIIKCEKSGAKVDFLTVCNSCGFKDSVKRGEGAIILSVECTFSLPPEN